MEPVFTAAIPILPATDVAESLKWWTEICGFEEVFCYGDPPSYAGVRRGKAALHLSGMDDAALARTVGEQTMLRLQVEGIEAYLDEYKSRGGDLHPNSRGLEKKPWGSVEFAVIDPNGVCVTFLE